MLIYWCIKDADKYRKIIYNVEHYSFYHSGHLFLIYYLQSVSALFSVPDLNINLTRTGIVYCLTYKEMVMQLCLWF